MNELKDKITRHYTEQNELSLQISNAIYNLCKENGGTISFDERDEENQLNEWAYEEGLPEIIYDGGRHPEYQSSLCCSVWSVSAMDYKDPIDGKNYNVFSVETEEGDLNWHRLFFDDKVNLLENIESFLEWKRENEANI